MTEDVDSLIADLELWRTPEGRPSHRDTAIAELQRRSPHVVPALVERLQALLTSSRRPRDHQGVPDRARYDRESLDLRQGLLQALARIGDERATAVLIAALDDDACVPYAAAALRQTPDDQAVEPLLDALARMPPNGTMVDDLIDTLMVHGVSPEHVRARWRTEPSPRGRANLMRLLARHGDVPVSVFLEAAQDPFHEVRWAAIEGVLRVWRADGHDPDPAWTEVLLFLAVDGEKSVGWRAVDALEQMERGQQAEPDTHPDLATRVLTPPLLASVIGLALRSPGAFGGQLGARLANLVSARPDGLQAVRGLIGLRPPADVLRAALDMLPPLGADTRNPERAMRMLHRLLSHSDSGVREDAASALRRGDLLFPLLVSGDRDTRETARSAYAQITTAGYADRLDRYVSALPLRTRMRYRGVRR